MPYIDPAARAEIAQGVEPKTVGGLTYVLYRAAVRYLGGRGTLRFQDFAEVLGALESARQEFYRRHVVSYENQKLAENGDVT